MESDIILEGFSKAEQQHGVRYINFIGDGDSSVHTTLTSGVYGWGSIIAKQEYANHMVKCYRSALEICSKISHNIKEGINSLNLKKMVSCSCWICHHHEK